LNLVRTAGLEPACRLIRNQVLIQLSYVRGGATLDESGRDMVAIRLGEMVPAGRLELPTVRPYESPALPLSYAGNWHRWRVRCLVLPTGLEPVFSE
jgi:hypothetical protein